MAQHFANVAAHKRQRQEEKRVQQIHDQQQQALQAAEHAKSTVGTSFGEQWAVYCPRCEKATLSANQCPCPNCHKPLRFAVITRGSGSQLWRATCSLPCTPNSTESESVKCPRCRADISPQFYRWITVAAPGMSTASGCLLSMLILPCAWVISGLIGIFMGIGFQLFLDPEPASIAGMISTLVMLLLGTGIGIYLLVKLTNPDAKRPPPLSKIQYHGFQPPPHWQ